MHSYWQVAGALALPGTDTTLESNTNAPPVNAPANNLPHEVALVFIVTLADARMLPCQSVASPSVAEELACQNTLEALAPLIRRMRV